MDQFTHPYSTEASLGGQTAGGSPCWSCLLRDPLLTGPWRALNAGTGARSGVGGAAVSSGAPAGGGGGQAGEASGAAAVAAGVGGEEEAEGPRSYGPPEPASIVINLPVTFQQAGGELVTVDSTDRFYDPESGKVLGGCTDLLWRLINAQLRSKDGLPGYPAWANFSAMHGHAGGAGGAENVTASGAELVQAGKTATYKMVSTLSGCATQLCLAADLHRSTCREKTAATAAGWRSSGPTTGSSPPSASGRLAGPRSEHPLICWLHRRVHRF